MTTELIQDTSLDYKALAVLGKKLSNDREALLQLLINLSKKTTFQRIVNCPTYPLSLPTADLEERRELLSKSIKKNAFELCFALGYLYGNAADIKTRKKFGQFFTSPYVARMAISRLDLKANELLLDAGCGTGIFPLTLLNELNIKQEKPDFYNYLGVETSPLLALATAVALDSVGAPKNWRIIFANYLRIQISDIEKITGTKKIDAIISNPPYVRCHRLGTRDEFTKELELLGYSGLHSFFIGRSAKLIGKGRMLFLIPLEMMGTKYGSAQFNKLDNRFKINPEIVYLDSNDSIWKSTSLEKIPLTLFSKIKQVWNLTLFSQLTNTDTLVTPEKKEKEGVTLGALANVHRGISTGANDFFVVTQELCDKLCLKEDSGYLTKIIPTRLPKTELKKVFTIDDWENLKEKGNTCWLLSFPKFDNLSDITKDYITKGKSLGIHLTPTSKSRQVWHYIKVPKTPPDLFFTYISRGYPLFIANKARVYNLTNMLGIYFEKLVMPWDSKLEPFVDSLNFSLENWISTGVIGRRYKGGIVKLEPTDLLKMPISEATINMSKGKKLIS